MSHIDLEKLSANKLTRVFCLNCQAKFQRSKLSGAKYFHQFYACSLHESPNEVMNHRLETC